jgi:hypothetical protein
MNDAPSHIVCAVSYRYPCRTSGSGAGYWVELFQNQLKAK